MHIEATDISAIFYLNIFCIYFTLVSQLCIPFFFELLPPILRTVSPVLESIGRDGYMSANVFLISSFLALESVSIVAYGFSVSGRRLPIFGHVSQFLYLILRSCLTFLVQRYVVLFMGFVCGVCGSVWRILLFIVHVLLLLFVVRYLTFVFVVVHVWYSMLGV